MTALLWVVLALLACVVFALVVSQESAVREVQRLREEVDALLEDEWGGPRT